MSNKDTSNEACLKKNSKINLFEKEEMLLFSCQLLKSKKIFNIFQTNSFRYEFIEEKEYLKLHKDSEDKKKKVNNRVISIIDDENNSSLKTLNIEVPSAEKLLNKEFKDNFLKDYNNSFAHFCGINKEQYENIYVNNKYIPIIDNFGDIKINIKNIIEILKEYSNEKKTSKIPEKQKLKKKFIMTKRNRDNSNIFKFPFKVKIKKLNKKNKIQKNINDNNINNNINNNTNIKPINNNNIQRNHLSFNLKEKGKGLSISIPKERNNNFLNNNRPLLNLGNNKTLKNLKLPNKNFSLPMGNIINNNYIQNIPNINPATINSVISNSRQQHSNSDIFNFSNRDIRNYLNIGSINNANFLANLSPNIPLLTPLISPFPLSPYHSLFSAHLGNNILQDGSNFNNTIINPNPLLFPPNSPALINININNNINLNNNLVNGNIINNNISNSQNNSFKNSNNSNLSNNS